MYVYIYTHIIEYINTYIYDYLHKYARTWFSIDFSISISGCLVMALRSMDRKKEALSEAEKALEAAEELTKGHAAGSPVPRSTDTVLKNLLVSVVSRRFAKEVEKTPLLNEVHGFLVVFSFSFSVSWLLLEIPADRGEIYINIQC